MIVEGRCLVCHNRQIIGGEHLPRAETGVDYPCPSCSFDELKKDFPEVAERIQRGGRT